MKNFDPETTSVPPLAPLGANLYVFVSWAVACEMGASVKSAANKNARQRFILSDVSQGFDGIHHRGPFCGVKTENNPDRN